MCDRLRPAVNDDEGEGERRLEGGWDRGGGGARDELLTRTDGPSENEGGRELYDILTRRRAGEVERAGAGRVCSRVLS